MNEPTAWIVYQADWSGIEIYFDELTAYKAAVGQHAEVVQVGAGDVKEQAKTPRNFNQPNEENNNGGTIATSNNGSPAPSNAGAQSRPKEKGGAQIVDQDAALKEAQREAAQRSQRNEGDAGSFLR